MGDAALGEWGADTLLSLAKIRPWGTFLHGTNYLYPCILGVGLAFDLGDMDFE